MKRSAITSCFIGIVSLGLVAWAGTGAVKSEATRSTLEKCPAGLKACSSTTPAHQGVDTASDAPAADGGAAYRHIASLVGPQLYASLPADRQAQLMRAYEASACMDSPPILCFAPGTKPDVIEAFTRVFGGDQRAQLTGRWTATAIDGGGLTQGTPTTLTFSFVPDGTFVPDLIGVTGNSNLHAWLNGIYGSQAVWQPIFEDVFARWTELAGLTYVFEANDDGVNLNSSAGVVGVRGDLRIAAITIDGNSGVLAYNNFPNDGDMVLDSADNFFNITTNNSIRLRNVAAHEHGHGMGLLHVCPVNQTKLMEPFITTIFDGPQHDDIRGSQRHYGDPFEPDNSSGAATDVGVLAVPGSIDLGAVPFPIVSNGALLSIDANAEQDFFRFTLNQPAGVSVTVTPIGLVYDDSTQAGNGNCNSGSFTDSLRIANLALQLIDTNGSTVLADASAAAIGEVESVTDVLIPTAGEYFVRVFETELSLEAQLYRLSISAVPLPPLAISLPNGAPTEVLPGQTADFDVRIQNGAETLVGGSETLHYRFDGGTFLTAPLAPAGGDLFVATIPAANCGDTPEFFVSADGNLGSTVTFPSDAPTTVLSAQVGQTVVSFADDFEADLGWTVSGTALDGPWERAVPNVTCTRGNPNADFDGSGACFVTDNSTANNCNSDVDDGTTILTSPVFDLSNGGTISFAYWHNDISGGPLSPEDTLDVEVATDAAGTNWQLLRSYGTAAPIWRTDSIAVGVEVAASATLRIRFTSQDLGAQNVVESGIDAVQALAFECVVDCSAFTKGDVNDDTLIDGKDINTFVTVLLLGGGSLLENCAGDVEATPDNLIDIDDVPNFVDCILLGGCP